MVKLDWNIRMGLNIVYAGILACVFAVLTYYLANKLVIDDKMAVLAQVPLLIISGLLIAYSGWKLFKLESDNSDEVK